MGDHGESRQWWEFLGYAVGIGICFMATLGVWLQYSTKAFSALTAGAASLGAGVALSMAWLLLRRSRRGSAGAPPDQLG